VKDREEARKSIEKIDIAIRNIETVRDIIKESNKKFPDIEAIIELIQERNKKHPDRRIIFNEFLPRDIYNWENLANTFKEFKNIIEEKYDL